MNGRQKIEAAFSIDGTPEVPAVLCYEDIFIRDHWKQITKCPWWYAQSPDLTHQMAWRRDAIDAIGQDWMVLPVFTSRQYRETHSILLEQSNVFLLNSTTGEKRILTPPTVGGWEMVAEGYSGHVSHLAQTKTEINFAVPLPPHFNLREYQAEGFTDLAKKLLTEFGHDHLPLEHVSTPLWHCYFLWGFEGMMTMIADHPRLVKHACDRYLPTMIKSVNEHFACGAACVWIEDSLTDQISPNAFRTLNLPYIRAIVEEIRSKGMLSIYYFCGNPAGKLDLLMDTGADALALEESKKGFVIDLAEIVEVVRGRQVLFGNLDAIHQLPDADEKILRSEIRRQIHIGRNNKNRFVMSLGSPVTPETSLERVKLYCNLVREEGIK